ncbi:MAG TPA: flagellar motor switch protein FliN [Gallionella sp.]|nr:flagellar motor switch protein FliN [Gallionella sp.]
MAEETITSEEISADDWGAAMAEQATTADDWGSAMAEQTAAPTSGAEPAKPHAFNQFGASGAGTTQNDLDMILDIPVQLTVELGRTKMPIKNLLQLAQGSVVELAGLAGEPLDVMINGFLIAQGEVVVVNDKLGIRLTDIITPSERLRRINK